MSFQVHKALQVLMGVVRCGSGVDVLSQLWRKCLDLCSLSFVPSLQRRGRETAPQFPDPFAASSLSQVVTNLSLLNLAAASCNLFQVTLQSPSCRPHADLMANAACMHGILEQVLFVECQILNSAMASAAGSCRKLVAL